MHASKNQVEYEVISENPTNDKGFSNNTAKVAKFSLIQLNFKKAVSDQTCFIF
jgi:hypothetical protein